MTKEISINFLQHRRNFTKLFIHFMNRLKPENKKLIKINLLMTDNINFDWLDSDIEINIVNFGGNAHTANYYNKFVYGLYQDSKYFLEIDEDLFTSNYVWDYIIENRHILDDRQNLCISPVVNIGVPTCDWFMEDFCSQSEIDQLHQMFLKVNFNTDGDIFTWGYDYDILNNYTIRADKWNKELFFKEVAKLETDLKGVHPVRFSYNAQRFLCDIVLNNIHKFVKPNNYSLIAPTVPYLCNHMSIFRTDVLQRIHKEIGFHPYDEISINKYKKQYNLNHVFIKRGYALHTFFANVSRINPLLFDRMYNEECEIHDKILQYVQNNDY